MTLAPRSLDALCSGPFADEVRLPNGVAIVRSRIPFSLQQICDGLRDELNTTLWQTDKLPEQRTPPSCHFYLTGVGYLTGG